MNNTQKIAVAAASGAAVGALAGILFAPAKGSETRQQIADKASDVKENLSDIVDKGKDALNDLSNTAKEKGEEIKEAVA
jgi:gas vesicle protein